MTEAEWLNPTTLPSALLEAVRGRASLRKLYLVAVACTRRSCKLKPDGIAVMDSLEAAADAADLAAEVGTLHAAHGSFGPGLSPWDLASVSTIGPSGYEGVKGGRGVIREVFGNPFRPVRFDPAWRTTDIVLLALGVYAEKAFDRMPILFEDRGSGLPQLRPPAWEPNARRLRPEEPRSSLGFGSATLQAAITSRHEPRPATWAEGARPFGLRRVRVSGGQ